MEGPWALPERWRWERLGDVTSEPFRGSPSSKFKDAFRYLDVGGLGEGRVGDLVSVKDAPSRARQFLEAGDIALSTVRPYLRRTVHLQSKDADVASTAFCVLRAKPDLDSRFLFHWVTSDQFVSRLLPLQRGSSPPAVLDVDVRAQPVPVPPADLQRSLVSRIDTLFAEVAAGEEALAAAKASLGQWRQALLKAAVTGDLTADWRAANPPAETGEALLARILADRRTRWTQDPRNKGKRYPEPPRPDTTILPNLPDGWTWASLEQVAELNPSITPPAAGEVPFLPMAAVEAATGRVDASGRRDVAKVKTGFTRFAAGDVLFAKITPCMENGKIAVVPDEVGAFGAGSTEFHVIRSRWLPPSFLWAYLVQQAFRQEAARNMTGTAGQMRVPKSYLETLAVPVGPKAELEAAIEKLADMNSQTDPIEATQQEGSSKAQFLRQSILAAAFRGELAA